MRRDLQACRRHAVSGDSVRVGQARRRDANEASIVDALEEIGVKVYRLSEVGLPDLLTYHHREGLRLIEVKMPGGKLTAPQETTRRFLPIAIVESTAEALALFGVVDSVRANAADRSVL